MGGTYLQPLGVHPHPGLLRRPSHRYPQRCSRDPLFLATCNNIILNGVVARKKLGGEQVQGRILVQINRSQPTGCVLVTEDRLVVLEKSTSVPLTAMSKFDAIMSEACHCTQRAFRTGGRL